MLIILFTFSFSLCYAVSVDLSEPLDNQIAESATNNVNTATNNVNSENNVQAQTTSGETSNVNNTATQQQYTDNSSYQNNQSTSLSNIPSTTVTAAESLDLSVSDIINIFLIVIGVILILLGIAILIKTTK